MSHALELLSKHLKTNVEQVSSQINSIKEPMVVVKNIEGHV